MPALIGGRSPLIKSIISNEFQNNPYIKHVLRFSEDEGHTHVYVNERTEQVKDIQINGNILTNSDSFSIPGYSANPVEGKYLYVFCPTTNLQSASVSFIHNAGKVAYDDKHQANMSILFGALRYNASLNDSYMIISVNDVQRAAFGTVGGGFLTANKLVDYGASYKGPSRNQYNRIMIPYDIKKDVKIEITFQHNSYNGIKARNMFVYAPGYLLTGYKICSCGDRKTVWET